VEARFRLAQMGTGADVGDFPEFYAGVVRVDGPEGVGTGFVASSNGLIVTCAHLLVGCIRGDIVNVLHDASRQPLQATVEVIRDPPDVAILKLEVALPPEVAVLPLGPSPRAARSGLLTFGYPKLRPEDGLPGELAFYGLTKDVGFRQLVLRSNEATLGYSGAPIWDPERHVVVGIIKSIATQDPGERLRDTAIGVPAEVIQHLHSKLRNPAGSLGGVLEPLGVCFVSSEYPPQMVGGLGSHVEQLTAAIGQHIDVNIVVPSSRIDYDDPSCPRVQLSPLTGTSPSYNAPISWLPFSTNAADRIDSMIDSGASFDVIHCHDWVTVLAGVRCRWRHGIPLVFHMHLPNRTPLCASIENLGLACADLITVNSESMGQELRSRSRSLGLETRPIHVINNGVDLDVFHPREDWPADDGYVLFVGRLVAQKGLEYLLRAFYYVLQKFPDIRLKIVGEGELGEQLKRLCMHLMIPSQQVDFLYPSHWLTRQELAELYQGARVVVVPSIYEPFGMTAIEALACQRPVVASRTGGLMETIKHNVNGFLTEPRDELDLAQWIMTLLSDPELRNRFGEEGRRRLRTEYTWPRIAQRVIQLYGDLPMSLDSDTPPPKADEFRKQILSIVGRPVPDLFEWTSRL
jgi:glycosyltransferase involved in cell wall biosynthesis